MMNAYATHTMQITRVIVIEWSATASDGVLSVACPKSWR